MKDALIFEKSAKLEASQSIEGELRIGRLRGPMKWSTLAVYYQGEDELLSSCGLIPWKGEVVPFRSPATAYLVHLKDGFFAKKWGRIRRGMGLYLPLKNNWLRIKNIFFLSQPISSILSPQILRIEFHEDAFLGKGEVLVGEEIPPSLQYEVSTEAPDGTYRILAHGFSCEGYLSGGILKLSNPFLFFRGDPILLNDGKRNWCGRIKRIRRGEGKPLPDASDEEVLVFLAHRPISSREIMLQTGWRRTYIEELMLKLSSSGSLRVLNFAELSALSREGIEELVGKMEAKLKPFHRAKPQLLGMEREKLREKLGVSKEVFSIALSSGVARGRLKLRGDAVSLADFVPESEKKIQQTKDLVEGMVRPSMVEMERILRGLKNRRMVEQIIAELIEEGRLYFTSGFLVHRDYLEDIVKKLQGKREFTVQEFKAITGLSRKYAIPLLELLDSLGITERIDTKRRKVKPEIMIPD